MRVLVGHIYHESNTFAPEKTPLSAFERIEGEAMLPYLPGVDVLREAGAEVVPTIYAQRWSSGTVEEVAFRYFERRLLAVLTQEKECLDGIYLSLHGGMTVEQVGSGEYHLLKSVREVVGDELPIAISLDMHASNQSGIEKLANVITGYHTAPHTDAAETQRKAARALLRLIKSGERVHPVLVRAPMLLVGERAITADEPFRTIFARCKALEAGHMLAATLFVGMAWGDTPNTTVTAVVTPASEAYAEEAEREAQWMAETIFARRNECRYAHPAFLPEEAVDRALSADTAPLYLSDSGDNPTAGGVGDSTVLLRLVLARQTRRRVLFAPILDDAALRFLKQQAVGDVVQVAIGSQRESYCALVLVSGQIIRFGEIEARHGLTVEKQADYALLRVGTVDVVVVNAQMAFTGMECFASARVSVTDYDVVVLKMGYMFDEISSPCRGNIMALTPGCTPLLMTAEQYHHLPRPIWPLDEEAKLK